MNLSEVFDAGAYKLLRFAELYDQHEINGTNALRAFFDTPQELEGTMDWRYFSDKGIVRWEDKFTFYDGRRGNPDRPAEWRLYFYKDCLPKYAEPEDVLVLTKIEAQAAGSDAPIYCAFVFQKNSIWLQPARELFGFRTDGTSALISDDKISKGTLTRSATKIVEQFSTWGTVSARGAAVSAELRRRKHLWESLRESGKYGDVPDTLLARRGVLRGPARVWRDVGTTHTLTQSGAGVAVSLRASGPSTFEDGISADGASFRYPCTKRPGNTDANEIDAIKAASKLGLPVFYLTSSGDDDRSHNVRLAWIDKWDDALQTFVVTFDVDNEVLSNTEREQERSEEPFVLEEIRKRTVWTKVAARPNQQRFRLEVLQRYGVRCAVCKMDIRGLLDAVHLLAKKPGASSGGTDDARNGLVLCAVHHRAFDIGLFGIEPNSLQIRYKEGDNGPSSLRIDHDSIKHLPEKPHPDALTWVWRVFSQQLA